LKGKRTGRKKKKMQTHKKRGRRETGPFGPKTQVKRKTKKRLKIWVLIGICDIIGQTPGRRMTERGGRNLLTPASPIQLDRVLKFQTKTETGGGRRSKGGGEGRIGPLGGKKKEGAAGKAGCSDDHKTQPHVGHRPEKRKAKDQTQHTANA